MKKSGWINFGIGFGAVTLIAGCYLIFQKDYAFGLCGLAAGIFLIYTNKMHLLKDRNAR